MDARTVGAWIGIPMLMAGALWIMATTPVSEPVAATSMGPDDAPVCDDVLATTRSRTIGSLGFEIQSMEVAEEHVEYHDRRMQWGYQAIHGDMHITMSWDPVSEARQELELFIDDRHGVPYSMVGTSPLNVTVAVPPMEPDAAWVVDLWVAPTAETDTEARTQGVSLELRSSC